MVSAPADLEGLHEQVESFGPRAFLVTVSGEGLPHVVSVLVRRQGDDLVLDAGRTSRANVRSRPTVTLLWPPPGGGDGVSPGGGDYSLLVDGRGEAASDSDAVTIRPTAAVLHRLTGAAGAGPGCIPVLPRD